MNLFALSAQQKSNLRVTVRNSSIEKSFKTCHRQSDLERRIQKSCFREGRVGMSR